MHWSVNICTTYAHKLTSKLFGMRCKDSYCEKSVLIPVKSMRQTNWSSSFFYRTLFENHSLKRLPERPFSNRSIIWDKIVKLRVLACFRRDVLEITHKLKFTRLLLEFTKLRGSFPSVWIHCSLFRCDAHRVVSPESLRSSYTLCFVDEK